MTSSTAAPIRTTVLAALGGALEYFDFVLFALLAKPLGDAFFPTEAAESTRLLKTYGVFAVGYVARPFGGLFFSHRADREGRKNVFAQTVALMAITAAAIAVLPGYATLGIAAPILLIVLRIFQGLAFGGELPGAMCFLAEQVPAAHRCFALGILIAAVNAGNLLAHGVIMVVTLTMSPEAFHDFGWRVPFAIGAIGGLFSIIIRNRMSETPVFEKLKSERRVERVPVKTLLRDHTPVVAHMLALVAVHAAAISLFMLALPNVLPRITAISEDAARTVSTWITAVSLPCYVVGGFLADRVGRRVTVLTTLAASVLAAIPAFVLMTQGHALLGSLVGVVPACLFVGAYLAGMVDAFPAPVRTSGIGLSYNIGYALVGGGIPMYAAWLLDIQAPAWTLGVLFGGIALLALIVESVAPRPSFAK